MTARFLPAKAGSGPGSSDLNRGISSGRGIAHAGPASPAGSAAFHPSGSSLVRTVLRHVRANVADLVAGRPGVPELVSGLNVLLTSVEAAPLGWLADEQARAARKDAVPTGARPRPDAL